MDGVGRDVWIDPESFETALESKNTQFYVDLLTF